MNTNNTNTCSLSQEDSNIIFKMLMVVNILIKNCQITEADELLSTYLFPDLSPGLQLYYRYLQTRLYLAAFSESGSLSDLLTADTCAEDMVSISKEARCSLRNYNYLVVRCICKSKLAIEHNDTDARSQARSEAAYLIGIGQSKYPEQGIFEYLMQQLEDAQ